MELLCPAGSLPALKTAVDNGADAVYIGFRMTPTPAISPGSTSPTASWRKRPTMCTSMAANPHRHQHLRPPGLRCPLAAGGGQGRRTGADALIIADLAVLDYASRRYPDLELHVSVQASATNAAAIRFYQQHFNVGRVVLPASLHAPGETAGPRDRRRPRGVRLRQPLHHGEGRCYLSSYMTGESLIPSAPAHRPSSCAGRRPRAALSLASTRC